MLAHDQFIECPKCGNKLLGLQHYDFGARCLRTSSLDQLTNYSYIEKILVPHIEKSCTACYFKWEERTKDDNRTPEEINTVVQKGKEELIKGLLEALNNNER